MSSPLCNPKFLQHLKQSKAKTKLRMQLKTDHMIDRVYGQVLADLHKFFTFDDGVVTPREAQSDVDVPVLSNCTIEQQQHTQSSNTLPPDVTTVPDVFQNGDQQFEALTTSIPQSVLSTTNQSSSIVQEPINRKTAPKPLQPRKIIQSSCNPPTLLSVCGIEQQQNQLSNIDLLDVFIEQSVSKDSDQQFGSCQSSTSESVVSFIKPSPNIPESFNNEQTPLESLQSIVNSVNKNNFSQLSIVESAIFLECEINSTDRFSSISQPLTSKSLDARAANERTVSIAAEHMTNLTAACSDELEIDPEILAEVKREIEEEREMQLHLQNNPPMDYQHLAQIDDEQSTISTQEHTEQVYHHPQFQVNSNDRDNVNTTRLDSDDPKVKEEFDDTITELGNEYQSPVQSTEKFNEETSAQSMAQCSPSLPSLQSVNGQVQSNLNSKQQLSSLSLPMTIKEEIEADSNETIPTCQVQSPSYATVSNENEQSNLVNHTEEGEEECECNDCVNGGLKRILPDGEDDSVDWFEENLEVEQSPQPLKKPKMDRILLNDAQPEIIRQLPRKSTDFARQNKQTINCHNSGSTIPRNQVQSFSYESESNNQSNHDIIANFDRVPKNLTNETLKPNQSHNGDYQRHLMSATGHNQTLNVHLSGSVELNSQPSTSCIPSLNPSLSYYNKPNSVAQVVNPNCTDQSAICNPPISTNNSSTNEKSFYTLSVQCHKSGCTQMFTQQDELKYHMWLEHSIGPSRCLARGCGQTFDSGVDLGIHKKQAHHHISKWHCAECPTHYDAYHNLHTHHYEYHQLGQFQCSYASCTFIGKYRGQMYNHYIQKHRPPRKCQHVGCNYETSNQGNLTRHELTHSKSYRCNWPQCHFVSTNRYDTLIHIRFEHLTPKPSSASNRAQLADPFDYFESV